MRNVILAGLVGIIINSTSVLADQISTFNSDQEGWQTAGDASPIRWTAEGGNPDGYIEIDDLSDGRTWYFVSPDLWAGDWRNYKKLSFDLKQIGNGSGFIDNDLIIVGMNGKQLTWKGERDPAAYWTSYTISLDSATFKTTKAYYDAIMKNVAKIMIRGEFISGPDTGGLDNVILSETPTSIHGTVNGFGRYNVVCKNNTTQQVITLNKNVKLDWDCEAMGLTINDGDSISVTLKGNAAK